MGLHVYFGLCYGRRFLSPVGGIVAGEAEAEVRSGVV